jgi:hypothetical protein
MHEQSHYIIDICHNTVECRAKKLKTAKGGGPYVANQRTENTFICAIII